MTIDVNLKHADEEFFDNLDDIIEDTMVQMFILHPKTSEEVEQAKSRSAEVGSLFYSVPLSLHDMGDENCVAFSVSSAADKALLPASGKPLIIDEIDLDDATAAMLSGSKGIILNATHEYPALEGFLLSIGASNVKAFESGVLAGLDMDRIVLHSGYPEYGFEEIFGAVKVISDAMFRPEQSIIARATKSSLELFGFR